MVNRRVSVTVDADVSPFVRGLTGAGVAAKTFAHELESADGRFAALVQTGLALAPALVPIGAAAVPALAGLTAQFGFAVAGAGTAVIAFQGVGDALKALNDYKIAPTEAHLAKLNETMNALGPAGRDFVFFLQSLRPQMQDLQDIAQEGMFPGLTEGIQDALKLKPEIEDLLGTISQTMGNIAADTGADLNSDQWREFMAFLDAEAAPTLQAMATTLGNVIHGFANMMMAFDPLADDFTNGMVRYSQAFEDWSAGLDQSASFQEFVDYVRTNGPEAMHTLGALADSLVSLVQAAAPVGSAVLPVITELAHGLSAIADSSVGPILIGTAAAVGTLGRSLALLSAVGLRGGSTGFMGRLFEVDKIKAGITGISGVAAATDELRTAQERQAQASVRARDAQFALIPTPEKRAALSAYVAESRKAASASEKVAAAEREQAAARRASYAQIGKNAAAIGGLVLATSGLAEETGLSNTASLALIGTLAGPWGAAVGAGVGLTMDLAAANNSLEAAVRAADAAMDSMDLAAVQAARDQIQALLDEQHPDEGTLSNYWDAVKGSLNDLTGATDEARGRLEGLDRVLAGGRTGLDLLTGGLYSAAQAEHNMAQTIDQGTASYADQTASIEDNLKAMRDRREEAARALNAELNYKASLLDARDALKENGKTVNENTRAGQANLRALYSIATAWNDQSDAAKNAKGSLKAARDGFVDTAVSMGMAEDKAWALAKRLFEIPEKVVTRHFMETSDSDRKIAGLKAQLASIDKDIYIRMHVQAPNLSGFGPQIDSAHGNLLRYAQGDVANQHQPELYRGAITRVWGEPETQGEAYIPLADDHRRPRARSILEKTATLLNGEVSWFADGGLVQNTHPRTPRGPEGEAAAELTHLGTSANRTRWAFEEISNSALKELKIRQRLLEHEVERDKQRRDALKQEFDSIRDAVASRFTDSIWDQPDPAEAAVADITSIELTDPAQQAERQALLSKLALRGMDQDTLAALAMRGSLDQIRMLANGTDEQLQQFTQAWQSAQATAQTTNEYNAAIAATQTPQAQLKQQILEMKYFDDLLAQLENRGLDGAALKDAAQNASLEQLQGLVSGSNADLQQYEQLFNQRDRLAGQSGTAVAMAVVGDELKAANQTLHQSQAELKAATQAAKRMEKLLTDLKKTTGVSGPDRIVRGIRHGVGNAARGSRK